MQFDHIAENLILVTRPSLLTGKINSMEIPARQGQVEYWFHSGELIQNCLGWLTPDQREFLMTGATPEEWDSI